MDCDDHAYTTRGVNGLWCTVNPRCILEILFAVLRFVGYDEDLVNVNTITVHGHYMTSQLVD